MIDVRLFFLRIRPTSGPTRQPHLGYGSTFITPRMMWQWPGNVHR